MIDAEGCTLHLKFRRRSEYERWSGEISKFPSPYTSTIAEMWRGVNTPSGSQGADPTGNSGTSPNGLRLSGFSAKCLLSATVEDMEDLADRIYRSTAAPKEPELASLNAVISLARERILSLRGTLEKGIIPRIDGEVRKRDILISFMMKALSSCKEGDSLMKKAISQSLSAISDSVAFSPPALVQAPQNAKDGQEPSPHLASYPETWSEEFFDAVEHAYLCSGNSNALESTSDYDETSIKSGSDDNDGSSSSESNDGKNGSFNSMEGPARLVGDGEPQMQQVEEPLVPEEDVCATHRTSLPTPEVPTYSKGIYSLLKCSVCSLLRPLCGDA